MMVYLAKGVILGIPETKNGFQSITTSLFSLYRRVYFIPEKGSDNSVCVSKDF